jgi:hypothetical protein
MSHKNSSPARPDARLWQGQRAGRAVTEVSTAHSAWGWVFLASQISLNSQHGEHSQHHRYEFV